MDGRLGQSVSKTAGLVGCYWYAVVSPYKSGPGKDNLWTGDRVFGAQGLLMYKRNKD